MSLKLWLPLNGNTENIGQATITPIITESPVYVDGKITNKALSTGGLKLSADNCGKVFNSDEMTFAFWLYVPQSTTTTNIIFGNGSMTHPNNRKFSIFQWSADIDPCSLHLSWQSDTSDSADIITWAQDNFFERGNWVHTAIVYNRNWNVVKVYKNGELAYTPTLLKAYPKDTNFSNETDIINSSTTKYLNDFRVYDRALSNIQIKNIYTGLILHHNFEQLISNSTIPDCSGFNNYLSNAKNITIDSSDTGLGSVSAIFNNKNYTPEITDTVCSNNASALSVWVKTSTHSSPTDNEIIMSANNDIQIGLGFYNSNGFIISSSSTKKAAVFKYDGFKFGEWNYLVVNNDVLYINGVKATINKSVGIDYWQADKISNQITFGYRIVNNEHKDYFYGKIADIKLYANELTESEIKSLYEDKTIIDKTNRLYVSLVKETAESIIASKTSILSTQGSFVEDNSISEISASKTKFYVSELIEI